MTVDATCLCGHTVQIDTSKPDPSGVCAICGRVVKPPAPKPKKKKKKQKTDDHDPFADLAAGTIGEPTDLSEDEDKLRPTLIAVGAVVAVAFLGLVVWLIAGVISAPSAPKFVASRTQVESSEEGGGTGTHGNGPGSGTSGTGTGAGDHGTGTGAIEGKADDAAPAATTEPAEPVVIVKEDTNSNLPEDGINVPTITKVSANAKRGHGIGLRGASGLAARRRNGATSAVDVAVKDGLTWLASVQETDGSWKPSRFQGNDQYAVGVTGLATLAFLGDGHFPGSHTPFEKNVTSALEFILSKEDVTSGKFVYSQFYEQAICTMCLCEAFALTGDDRFHVPAQNAINHIISNIGTQGGFGYQGPGTDTSVTGFCIMALKSGAMADLDEPPDAIKKIKGYLDAATGADGQTGYQMNNTPKISMTAAGLFCRLFLKYGLGDAKVIKAVAIVEKTGVNVNDEYYNYYATYGMFQVGGIAWRKYNYEFLGKLLKLQEKNAEGLRGSFPPSATSVGAPVAGRIYATSMYLISLEVYSRYLPVYRSDSDSESK